MKKTLMILGVLAALSMVFVGCDQPTTTEDATGATSSTPTTQAATTDADKTDAATPAAAADDDANNSGDQSDDSGDKEVKLTKTSILNGIQSGENVWGSGTNITENSDGTYTVVAAGDGEGGWGGKIAAIPVCFNAGDLTGFTYIVLEVDDSNFTLNEDNLTNEEYPAVELKLLNADDTKSKMINSTSLLKNGVAEIPLASVDFLDEVAKIQFAIRGTGTVIVKNISKAK